MEKTNKLIAEFMGMNIHHNDKSMMVKSTSQGNEVVPIDALQYDSSWDWLIPVIEKIQDLFVDDPELDWQLYDDIRYNVPYLDDTYNAVLYTIKQYNDGRKQ